MELRVFKEPRGPGHPLPRMHETTYPARTYPELAGLLRKCLRSGKDPRCMLLVRHEKDVTKIRWADVL